MAIASKTRLEYFRQYRKTHRDQKRASDKRYREKNKERIRQYYLDNRERLSKYHKEYHQKNRSRLLAGMEKYRRNNTLHRAEYSKNRLLLDIQYRLSVSLRNRLNVAIKGTQKTGSAIRNLGCTIPELKWHLERQFQKGMSWSNWGRTGWHIDHIIPLSKFDLVDPEQFKKACHYTNLQPLWARDNLKKRANLL